jgi:hypothetical protein
MTTATTISTMQREPTLLGQTVVLIGGSAGSGQRETPATASIRQGTLRPTRPGQRDSVAPRALPQAVPSALRVRGRAQSAGRAPGPSRRK